MMLHKTVNILLCGIGGQGVLTASELLAWAALFEGYHVKKTEVHGMAQRGGSVESHVRFGTKVFSPLIPYGEAHFLLPFHREEAARLRPFLHPAGTDLTGELIEAEAHLSEKRYLNTFLLGVLSQRLAIHERSWMKACDAVFAEGVRRENAEIFIRGRGGSHDME